MDLGLGVLPGRIQGDIILAKPCGLKVNKHDVVSPWSRKVYLKHGPGIKWWSIDGQEHSEKDVQKEGFRNDIGQAYGWVLVSLVVESSQLTIGWPWISEPKQISLMIKLQISFTTSKMPRDKPRRHHELQVFTVEDGVGCFQFLWTNLSLNQYFAMDNAQFLFQLEAEKVDGESYVRKWPSSFGTRSQGWMYWVLLNLS